MRAADFLVKQLEAVGVDIIFSYPGGPVLPLYDALAKNAVKNVLVRHEEAASFMADAYAKASGKLGVCASTMGPGALNMAIGVATAKSDSAPLLALTGQLPTNVWGLGYQQETDHVSIYRPITKMSLQVNRADQFPRILRRAIFTALSGRPGPVHLDIPKDVWEEEVGEEPTLIKPAPKFTAPTPLVEAALRLIGESEKPVILAGGGVIWGDASGELVKMAEQLGIPVATSYNGRGSIPEDHLLCLGRVGEFTPPYISQLLGEADLLIALGFRFTDVSMDGWRPRGDVKIIQVDIDPEEVGRVYNPTLPIVSDVKLFLRKLLEKLSSSPGVAEEVRSRHSPWIQAALRSRDNWMEGYWGRIDLNAHPIKPQAVVSAVRKILPRDALIAAEAGKCKFWAASLLPIYEPRTWIHSGGYAPMGYALCAAIGAKLAKPERTVVAVCGDGSFQMVCQEVATAVEQEAPILALIINDGYLGSMKDVQERVYGRVFGTEFRVRVDFAKLAEAFGARGYLVERATELEGTLRDALNFGEPAIIDVHVDPEEKPVYIIPQ